MAEVEKHVYLFPGHGSQRRGMGSEIYRNSLRARNIFDRADMLLKIPLSEICFFDPKNQLTGDSADTSVIQPALLTVSIATAYALKEQGIPPAELHLGLSLGKYSALVAGGSLEFDTALGFISERGKLMKESQNLGVVVGVVIGLGSEKIKDILQKLGEKAASFKLTVDNTTSSSIIGGLADQWEFVAGSLKDSGAKLVKPYKEAPLSHHPLLSPVQARLNRLRLQLNDANIPTLDDLSNTLIKTAEDVESSILDHLIKPISWKANIGSLNDLGVTRAVEVGPGNVLAGMMRREYPKIEVFTTDSWSDIDKVRASFATA